MYALAYLIGAGSFNLGVEAAGYKLLRIYETPGYSKNAATWDLNRPELSHRVLELNHTSDYFNCYRNHAVDLFYGNPPCGGVSAMTASRIGSPTNNCMRQWVRMVVHARPRMILMENGYQLATDRLWPLLTDLTNVLDEHGYYWWTWMFYSYQLGCPQIRRRMFLCASIEPPIRPELVGLDDLPSGDKRLAPIGPWLWDLTGVAPSPAPVRSQTGAEITQHWYGIDCTRTNELVKAYYDRINTPYLGEKDMVRLKRQAAEGKPHALKELQKSGDRYWPEAPREFLGMSCHRPNVLKWDEASGAIIGSFRYVHPHDKRMLTMREMARLMGYPDWWQFHRLQPHLIAQGIPVHNAYWAANRMAVMCGLKEK